MSNQATLYSTGANMDMNLLDPRITDNIARFIIKILCKNGGKEKVENLISQQYSMLRCRGIKRADMLKEFCEHYPQCLRLHDQGCEDSGDMTLEVTTDLKICPTHCQKAGSCPDNGQCGFLHTCKFYLLSGRCRFKSQKRTNCHFGHQLKTDHNQQVLKGFLLDHLELGDLRTLMTRRSARTPQTRPFICCFYNYSMGCAKGKNCAGLHICQRYLAGNCNFDTSCRYSHDLSEPRVKQMLDMYALTAEDLQALQADGDEEENVASAPKSASRTSLGGHNTRRHLNTSGPKSGTSSHRLFSWHRSRRDGQRAGTSTVLSNDGSKSRKKQNKKRSDSDQLIVNRTVYSETTGDFVCPAEEGTMDVGLTRSGFGKEKVEGTSVVNTYSHSTVTNKGQGGAETSCRGDMEGFVQDHQEDSGLITMVLDRKAVTETAADYIASNTDTSLTEVNSSTKKTSDLSCSRVQDTGFIPLMMSEPCSTLNHDSGKPVTSVPLQMEVRAEDDRTKKGCIPKPSEEILFGRKKEDGCLGEVEEKKRKSEGCTPPPDSKPTDGVKPDPQTCLQSSPAQASAEYFASIVSNLLSDVKRLHGNTSGPESHVVSYLSELGQPETVREELKARGLLTDANIETQQDKHSEREKYLSDGEISQSDSEDEAGAAADSAAEGVLLFDYNHRPAVDLPTEVLTSVKCSPPVPSGQGSKRHDSHADTLGLSSRGYRNSGQKRPGVDTHDGGLELIISSEDTVRGGQYRQEEPPSDLDHSSGSLNWKSPHFVNYDDGRDSKVISGLEGEVSWRQQLEQGNGPDQTHHSHRDREDMMWAISERSTVSAEMIRGQQTEGSLTVDMEYHASRVLVNAKFSQDPGAPYPGPAISPASRGLPVIPRRSASHSERSILDQSPSEAVPMSVYQDTTLPELLRSSPDCRTASPERYSSGLTPGRRMGSLGVEMSGVSPEERSSSRRTSHPVSQRSRPSDRSLSPDCWRPTSSPRMSSSRKRSFQGSEDLFNDQNMDSSKRLDSPSHVTMFAMQDCESHAQRPPYVSKEGSNLQSDVQEQCMDITMSLENRNDPKSFSGHTVHGGYLKGYKCANYEEWKEMFGKVSKNRADDLSSSFPEPDVILQYGSLSDEEAAAEGEPGPSEHYRHPSPQDRFSRQSSYRRRSLPSSTSTLGSEEGGRKRDEDRWRQEDRSSQYQIYHRSSRSPHSIGPDRGGSRRESHRGSGRYRSGSDRKIHDRDRRSVERQSHAAGAVGSPLMEHVEDLLITADLLSREGSPLMHVQETLGSSSRQNLSSETNNRRARSPQNRHHFSTSDLSWRKENSYRDHQSLKRRGEEGHGSEFFKRLKSSPERRLSRNSHWKQDGKRESDKRRHASTHERSRDREVLDRDEEMRTRPWADHDDRDRASARSRRSSASHARHHTDHKSFRQSSSGHSYKCRESRPTTLQQRYSDFGRRGDDAGKQRSRGGLHVNNMLNKDFLEHGYGDEEDGECLVTDGDVDQSWSEDVFRAELDQLEGGYVDEDDLHHEDQFDVFHPGNADDAGHRSGARRTSRSDLRDLLRRKRSSRSHNLRQRKRP